MKVVSCESEPFVLMGLLQILGFRLCTASIYASLKLGVCMYVCMYVWMYNKHNFPKYFYIALQHCCWMELVAVFGCGAYIYFAF
jgi:hypothetical protein